MGTPAFEPERVLAGRYRLERRLGKGGMGTIWVAEHLTLQAPVAVKLIDRDALPDEETIGRFLREAKAAATLRSPHVVQILDYGMDEGVPFIVMELLEGENLSQRLRRFGRLVPAETARIITHVCRAVARAHEAGIVHRDLKPENVFLVHNEDEEIAKVLDFGVAKVEHGSLGVGTRTRTGSILGTPYYMSPEQAQGNKTVDYRSDLWSLGVIAFECLTGKRPFYSEGLGDLVLQICVRDLPVPSTFATTPPGFDAWFARSVSRDPEQRFQSAREMADTLREALGVDRDGQGTSSDGFSSSSAGRGRLVPGSLRPADPTAATVALEPAEVQRLAQSDEVAPAAPVPPPASEAVRVAPSPLPPAMERRIRPVAEPPHPTGSGVSTIVAVAAAAMALGMAGGLVALWQLRSNKTPDDTTIEPSARQVPGEPAAVLPPELGSAKQDPAPLPEPDTEGAPNPSAATAPVAAPSASPPASADPRPAQSAVSARPRKEEEAVQDAGAAPVPTSDAGWVKPAWAVPDEEPRRAPDLMQEGEP